MDVLITVQLLAQKICAVLSFGINSVMIQLIMFRSPTGIGMYKYLMVYISMFELIYALLGLLIQPDFYSYSSLFLVVARTDRLDLPLWVVRIANTIFCSMFGMSMAMFTLHFIYRYCVIIGSPIIKMDSTLKIGLWFLSPLVYGMIWATILLTTLGPNEFTDELLHEHFLWDHHISIDQITYIGPNYYVKDSNGTETLNWVVMGGMSVIMMMVSISILTIIIFAHKCYKGVGKLLVESQHSEGYKVLQSQLLNMLLAQVAIPAVLMHTPASFLFTFPILHMASEIFGVLFCISAAFYPVLDPLPTMFMIQHYRQVLRTMVKKSLKF